MNTYQRTHTQELEIQQYSSTNKQQYRRLLSSYKIIIAGIVLIVLFINIFMNKQMDQFSNQHDLSEFFQQNTENTIQDNIKHPYAQGSVSLSLIQHFQMYTFFYYNPSDYYSNIQNQIVITQITINQQYKSTTHDDTNICLVINMLPIKSLAPEITLNNQLAKTSVYFDKIIAITHKDAEFNLSQILSTQMFTIKSSKQDISSKYIFLHRFTVGFKWVCFMQLTFSLQNISQLYNMIANSHEDMFAINLGNQGLQEIDLSMNSNVCENNLVILRQQLLHYILPLNFAYNSHYTFCQLVIYPSLALLQTSTIKRHMSINTQILSVHKNIIIPKIQFQLQQIQSINMEQTYCFIAVQTNSSVNNFSQISEYISSFSQITTANVYSIITISYPYSHSPNDKELLSQIKQLSQKINIRIKIAYKDVLSSLVLFQSSYQYCPPHSILILSRMNIIPNIEQIQKQTKQIQMCNKSVYMLIPNYNKDYTTTSLDPVVIRNPQDRQQHDHYYDSHLKHAQIICWNLIRTIKISDIKWQQLQFYQTQYSYSMMLLQKTSKCCSKISKQALFRLIYQRQQNKIQKQQRKGLLLRNYGKQISQDTQIKPIKFNALGNKALKRNAPQIIPRIIHQVFLNNNSHPKISEVRQELTNSLLKTNPEFTYMQWRLQNITKQNFPLSYEAILKLLKQNQKYETNYYAVIAGVMRIQILYRFGGIYCDMKTEGRKSLLPFLKYQQFFFHVGYGDKDGEGGLVNGLIGSIKGHKNFRTILYQYFQPNNITLPRGQKISEQAGSYRIVKAYKLKEMIVQITDFGPFLAGNTKRPCLNQNKELEFDASQKIFKGFDSNNQQYMIGLPCKVNTQKYLQMYRVLGRTYFGVYRVFQ